MNTNTIDITDWAPAKVEGFLTAIKSDQPGVEISVTFYSNGHQQMSMAPLATSAHPTTLPTSAKHATPSPAPRCSPSTASRDARHSRHSTLLRKPTVNPSRHTTTATATATDTDATRQGKKGRGRVAKCKPPQSRPRAGAAGRYLVGGAETPESEGWKWMPLRFRSTSNGSPVLMT
jgi:hypothetical protein